MRDTRSPRHPRMLNRTHGGGILSWGLVGVGGQAGVLASEVRPEAERDLQRGCPPARPHAGRMGGGGQPPTLRQSGVPASLSTAPARPASDPILTSLSLTSSYSLIPHLWPRPTSLLGTGPSSAGVLRTPQVSARRLSSDPPPPETVPPLSGQGPAAPEVWQSCHR